MEIDTGKADILQNTVALEEFAFLSGLSRILHRHADPQAMKTASLGGGGYFLDHKIPDLGVAELWKPYARLMPP